MAVLLPRIFLVGEIKGHEPMTVLRCCIVIVV